MDSSASRRFSGLELNPTAAFRSWRKWASAKVVVEKARGTDSKAIGPLLFTYLEGDAAECLEHIEMDQLNIDGGENVLMYQLASRYPEKEEADRIGESLEAAFGLRIEKMEATVAFTGRAKTIFARAEKEGVNLPSVARGFLLLKGARLGPERRAVVLAASGKRWNFEDLGKAMRTTYPKAMPEHSVHHVGQDEAWSAEDFGEESTTKDIDEELFMPSLEIEEEDAYDILATWKEVRKHGSGEARPWFPS